MILNVILSAFTLSANSVVKFCFGKQIVYLNLCVSIWRVKKIQRSISMSLGIPTAKDVIYKILGDMNTLVDSTRCFLCGLCKPSVMCGGVWGSTTSQT